MKHFVFFMFAATLLFACSGGTKQSGQVTTDPADIRTTDPTGTQQASDVTEVLYFHGKQRCITCNAIEELTRQIVDSLANEKVVLRIIDISQKKNESLADKYEVTWSSLILDQNGKVINLTETGFEYAKNQPQVFKAKLVEAIQSIAQ